MIAGGEVPPNCVPASLHGDSSSRSTATPCASRACSRGDPGRNQHGEAVEIPACPEKARRPTVGAVIPRCRHVVLPVHHARTDGDRAARAGGVKPCRVARFSVFKEQTPAAYPHREARGPCSSRTGRVKVVGAAKRHVAFVAFRSAKVAIDPRYFRGAKGDNRSPVHHRPSWNCANRSTVDFGQRGFGRSMERLGALHGPRGQSHFRRDHAERGARIGTVPRNWTVSLSATAVPLRQVRFACPRLHIRIGEAARVATRCERTGLSRRLATKHCFPGATRGNGLLVRGRVATSSGSPVRSEELWTCVIIAHAYMLLCFLGERLGCK